MDQPPLPEIKPYANRNLFSDHFLRELLPQGDSWQVDEDKLKLAMQALTHLYAGREDEWSQSNEAQLEDGLIRPALQALGHRFEVQPSLRTTEGIRRPDYAFFASDEERLRAKRQYEGEAEYFDRAIAVGDAKRWDRPLDRGERGSRDKFDRLSPSWQIDYYLRMSGVKWGFLTNGRLWRLCNQDTSFRLDVYYEIDLPRLLAARDLAAFKYFYLFFRRHALVPDAEGLRFLDRVYQGSLEYAQAVGDDLKENVYKALSLLAEGFLHTRDNKLDPKRDLDEIHANSLVLLYRLLFINYAEDRELLPRDNALYKESYGLVSMEREIASRLQRRESLPPLQASYWGKLKTLFDLINQGTEALGIDEATMQVPPYNGGLFDTDKHPFLEEHKVEDRWLAPVIDLLARSQADGVGGGFVDYSNLDVRHLGSIYEGLLEYKLRVADADMIAVKRRGKEQWIPAAEAGSSRVLERVGPGSAYLATDRGERKATGSYYTPDYIVKYIVDHTVGPLIKEKMKQADRIEGILALKVLDPAMGSGHFLVEATDRLAHALVEALGGADHEPEEEHIRWARREVVERCIYGVDLNPLAVELAKLSLWLHTVAEGKPLNFLDHHLKVGNSLIGAWVDDLGSLPAPAKKGKAEQADVQARQMNLFEIRLHEQLPVMLNRVLEIIRRRSDTLVDIKAKAAADQAVEGLRAPFRAVADLWVSIYFGNEVSQDEYQEALERIGEPAQLWDLPLVGRASETADERAFLHWELAFPEVFYEDSTKRLHQGFDAVIGNPPYANVEDLIDHEKRWLEACDREIFNNKNDQLYHFVLRATRLCNDFGRVGMIISRYMTEAHYAEAFRAHLAESVSIHEWSDFGDLELFEGINTRCVVFLMSPNRPDSGQQILVTRVDSWDSAHSDLFGALSRVALGDELPGVERFTMPHSELLRTGPWAFLNTWWRRIRAKIESGSVRLGGDSGLCRIGMGWNTGMDRAFTVAAGDIPGYGREAEHLRPLIKNGDIKRFEIRDRGLFWIDTRQLDLSECPIIAQHLARYKSALTNRYAVRVSAKRWYEYAVVNMPEVFLSPEKIVVPFKAPENRFALDRSQALASQDVYAMRLVDAGLYSHEYLLAILNSRPMTMWYRTLYGRRKKAEFDYYSGLLERIPIRRIRFTTPQNDRERLMGRAQDAYVEGDGAAALRLVDTSLNANPEQGDVVHDLLAYLAQQMMNMNVEKQTEARGFLQWLAAYSRLALEDWRLKTVLQGYWKQPWQEIQRALRQNRKAIKEASGRDVDSREAQEAIRREFEKSMTKLSPLLERIERTDRLIDLMVYRLYGLTDEEVAIVEGKS